MKILIDLFLIYFKIGMFSFGGGYAILAFVQREIIFDHHWMQLDEFIDVVAISQITPGPIAVNAATYVGYKLAGFLGALFATVGVISVSMILIIFAASILEKNKDSKYVKGLFKGLRPAVLGMIAAAVYNIGKSEIFDLKTSVMAILVFLVAIKVRLHPVIVILISGIIGIGMTVFI